MLPFYNWRYQYLKLYYNASTHVYKSFPTREAILLTNGSSFLCKFQANLQNCTIKLDLLGVELFLVPYKRSLVLFPFSASTAVPKKMAREVSAFKVVLHGYFGGVGAKTSTGACVTLFGSNDILQQVFVAVHK